MFTFLLVVQALIAASLVGVILMQQSEGGGLGMGGSPTGLMSARGAANFLTRATGILAVSFIGLSITLAVLATQKTTSATMDTSLARKPAPVAPAPVVPLSGDPVGQAAPVPSAPATAVPAPVVPMAGANRPVTPRPVTAPKSTAGKPVGTVPAASPKVVPTRTLPTPLMSNMPTPAPTDADTKGN